MSLSILNNIPSLEAQNQLAMTNTNLQNTLFQLSSGSKINSGADDPAGLSIADGLQANISALTQSAQNVTDGVGMLQTADGALSQVTTLLNRAVTLATEAGNAGLTTDQQNALQTEYGSITQEINQIGSNTTYNNNQVFTNQLTSVFLSDGSQVDSADPTISVTIPTLSAQSLGLSSYATGTLDLTNQPSSGNTVQIGQQTYTFVASGQANAAGDVALGNNVQGTLQNLKNAVNGTGTASPGTYGVGTAVNQSAQITSVNGGSATIQATAAGSAGNAVQLITNLTSSGGASSANLNGAVNATYDTGTLTLGAQPGVISTATGSISMTGQPITLTRASGVLNIATQPNEGDTVTVGDQTYRFEATADMAQANDVVIGNTLTATLNNLAGAVNGTGTPGAAAAAGATEFTGTAASTQATMYYGGSGTEALVTAMSGGTGGNSVALTSSITGAANPTATLSGGLNADTMTIGASTYTFVAAGQAVNPGQVAEGANVNATLTNLMDAVNGIGSGSNTTYGVGTAANATALITNVANGVASVEAAAAGVANPGAGGDTVNLAVTSGAGTATVSGSGTLAGGGAADTVTVGSTTYTFVAAGQASAGNEVALGATSQATLDNLKAAVNSTAIANGSAATYHLANAAALQGAAGATITSDASGVAHVQAEVAGVLGSPIGLSVSFAGGNATGTLAGLTTGDLSGGAAASAATGNFDLTANPASGNTLSIGNQTYTFVAAGMANAANEVAIGANVQGTLGNLQEAVNNGPSGTGAGTDYGTGTVANTSATITAVSGGQATVTAITLGTTGNSVAISATLTNGAGGGVVGTNNLAGGGASVSLTSATAAQSALTVIAGAISTVASTRGAIGSSINQMNAAVQVMQSTTQNLTSSLSGIQDANIGMVVANMSKYQVLEQTGIAALTQANQQEQTVLKLLQ